MPPTPRRSDSPSLAERGMVWALGVLFVGSPLLWGTVTTRPWPMLGVRAAVTLLFLLLLGIRLQSGRGFRPGLMGLALGVWLAAALLQLLPLPQPWIQAINPEADRLFSLSLESLGEYGPGAWRPLSLDPVETAYGASSIAVLFMAFLLGRHLAGRKHAFGRLFSALIGAGGLVALIGFVQLALGRSDWLGVPTRSPFPSTFVNPNHLAAFLGFTLPLALTAAVRETAPARSLPLWGLSVLIASAQLLTLSRSGLISSAIGLSLLFLFWKRRGAPKRFWLGAPAAILILAGVSVILFPADWKREMTFFSMTREGHGAEGEIRADLWRDTLTVAQRHPVTGIGAEAFKVAYPVYKTTLPDRTFTYPESTPLQWVAEVGIVPASLLIGAFLVTLARAFRRASGRRKEALLIALFTLGLHDLADFSLTAFSVALPAFLFLGVLSRPRRTPVETAGGRPPGRLFSCALALLLIGTAAGGEAVWLTHNDQKDRDRLEAAVYGPAPDPETGGRVLREALRRHPVDYHLHLIAAGLYPAESLSDAPMRLFHLKKAQALNPRGFEIDRRLGRTLARMGERAEARRAYAEALVKHPISLGCEEIWREMLAEGLTPDDLAQSVPPYPEHVYRLARFLDARQATGEAERMIGRYIERHAPSSPHLEALRFLRGELCVRLKRFEEAGRLSAELLGTPEGRARGWRLTARVQEATGETEAALRSGAKAEELAPTDPETLYDHAGRLFRNGRLPEARRVALNLLRAGRGDDWWRARAFILLARIEEAEGDPSAARREWEQALRLEPDNGEIRDALKALDSPSGLARPGPTGGNRE